MNISGKVAVVTGGASGLGRALALTLAQRQCRVVVADIELGRAEEVVSEIKGQGGSALAAVCDVRDYESVRQLADTAWQHYGEVHLLFNNAGVVTTSTAGLIDSDPVDLQWVLSVNVTGVWNGCSVFGKRFIKQSAPSRIVNTCSEHGLGMAHAGQGFYTASKHAILGLSDVLRSELPGKVGVSVLCPGLVQTDLWNAGRNRPQQLDQALAPLLAMSKAVMDKGMSALEVAAKALDGVERGDFFIVTHPHARKAAEKRWNEIAAAFDSQAPMAPGAELYDVNVVAQSVMVDLQRAASLAKAGPKP